MSIAIVLGAQIDLFFTYTRYHLGKIASPRPSPPPTSNLTRTPQQARRYVGSLTQMGGGNLLSSTVHGSAIQVQIREELAQCVFRLRRESPITFIEELPRPSSV